MNRALLLLTAIIIILASCYKKSTSNQKNWYCVRNDSLVSNKPALKNDHYKVIQVNYDAVNENYIKFLITKYTYMDTLFFRNDTLETEYWTMGCTQME